MSIKDITDYVRLTPGNTNPSVIGSMVQSEVNGTLKESKAYTDQEVNNLKNSGGVGYVETAEPPITFDGDGTGKETLDNSNGRFVKIIDAETDFSKVTKVVVSVEGDELVFSRNQLSWESEQFQGYTISALYVLFSEEEKPLVAFSFNKGTFILANPQADYVSRIEFGETIHPIDPKFLPKGGVGYEEKSTKIILPKTAFEVGENMMQGASLGLVDGGKYKVVFNGAAYNCTAKAMATDVAADSVLLGNLSVLGGEDTGEPFLIMDCASIPCFLIAPMENSNIAIYEETEIIRSIDPKFIPGAVLPVVEITSAVDEGGLPVGLTKEESDALTAAHKTGLPCIIKIAFNMGEPITATAAKVQGMFIVEIPFYKITIGFSENAQTDYGWAMQMMVES